MSMQGADVGATAPLDARNTQRARERERERERGASAAEDARRDRVREVFVARAQERRRLVRWASTSSRRRVRPESEVSKVNSDY